MRRPFHTQLLVGPPSSKWPVPVAVDIRLADSNGSPLPQALPEHWEAALQRLLTLALCMPETGVGLKLSSRLAYPLTINQTMFSIEIAAMSAYFECLSQRPAFLLHGRNGTL